MVTRNYDLKTAQDYKDYLEKLGFNDVDYGFLNGELTDFSCRNKVLEKIVNIYVEIDKDYENEIIDGLHGEEVEFDLKSIKVKAISIESHITSEENYIDGTNGRIYLIDKNKEITTEDYYRHDLSLFKYLMGLYADKGVAHEYYILQQHIKHLDWINSVLTPVLLKADYYYNGSDIFSIKEGSRVDSNLCVYFTHPNNGFQNDFWAGTDCLTGEFICEDYFDIFGKTEEELWDFLMENYWKADNAKHKFEIGKYTYLYTEGQDINTYRKYIDDLRKKNI